MYFKTNHAEYRRTNGTWQKRVLGTKVWLNVPKNLWQSIYELRKSVMGNRRPCIADTCRIKLGKFHTEKTKHLTKFATDYGVDTDRLVTND